MGVYIYRACPPSQVIHARVAGTGELVEIVPFKYAYKPYVFGWSEDNEANRRLHNRTVAHSIRAWRGIVVPRYWCYADDKGNPHSRVYEHPFCNQYGGQVSFPDSREEIPVGNLIRNGKEWVFVCNKPLSEKERKHAELLTRGLTGYESFDHLCRGNPTLRADAYEMNALRLYFLRETGRVPLG